MQLLRTSLMVAIPLMTEEHVTQLDGFIRAANTYVGADKLSTQQAQQIIQTLPYSAQALRTSLGCNSIMVSNPDWKDQPAGILLNET